MFRYYCGSETIGKRKRERLQSPLQLLCVFALDRLVLPIGEGSVGVFLVGQALPVTLVPTV